jgi:hypothetical protein
MIASFSLLGTGAMNSPRYRPAGLLVRWGRHRVMLDGGGDATPDGPIDAWLVSDDHAELMPDIRVHAHALGVRPHVTAWHDGRCAITPWPVVHTSHPTYGYDIELPGHKVIWAPEFLDFPDWASGADLMFADAAGWQRPIRFAGGVGGHACVIGVADAARRNRVKRLVFAHIGRPSIRARDAGAPLPYGEWGCEGRVYQVRIAATTGRGSAGRAGEGGTVG